MFVYQNVLYFKIPFVEHNNETCGAIIVSDGSLSMWTSNSSVLVQPISQEKIGIKDAWDSPELTSFNDIKPGEGLLCDNEGFIKTEKIKLKTGEWSVEPYDCIAFGQHKSYTGIQMHSFLSVDLIKDKKGLKFTKMEIEL